MSDAESEESLEALVDDAIESIGRLEGTLADSETIDDLDDDTLETVVGDLDTLVRVAEEAAELLEAIDVSELPDAVDGDELLDAIELGEIPDAVADEETGATDLVDFTELLGAIDLLNAWNAADLTDVWENKRELDAALDDLEDGDDAGMLEDAVSDVADGGDDGEGLLGDDEDGVLDSGMDAGAAAKEALGDIDVAEDPEAYQVAIQQQAMRGIDAFRAALLETHEKFERLYEFNREKMRRQDRGTNSRNPTASSTMPVDRRDLGGGARYSTVPQDVKLSTAPSRKRIYGRRFELERERQRQNERPERQRRNERQERQR
ncbi:hypothetical protein NP511_21885 [Natrinema thermotolerans]|uniref:Uncharacterized protein n=1 Tax=Natrinema thermotolerans TaxID=121872 RepID=A0AAF0PEY6_9EURY|nr:hypothetical protein [Natrinema thermotolerans]QCC61250.1 hypothetical protein DVR14_21705 [Natrinema thermotolerans]WMT07368.1 hypothetical protein NP511_18525 [Natrinema thermotolerans]WMT08000.1 hypothetical protein NP511_21885 [Natrinema thermotolerans]